MFVCFFRPWPARDINSFLKNIKTVPLRFPYDKPIGKLTKDFIMHCLTINEDLRLGWEEVNEPIKRYCCLNKLSFFKLILIIFLLKNEAL